ncbi:hypothetical protein CXR23_07115 [Brevibacterium aurantiacum]|uniref:Transposase n=1 Tax=Brevibacterium aurantiacum TaxID=273384 RepID=A0A3Q9NQS3_BREAU|nr:hypothetical protein CXR23_07115 [Brevibacterium aurantiacum]
MGTHRTTPAFQHGQESSTTREQPRDRLGIAYRHRVGIAWRDLLREHFGPWQTVWKRHRRRMGPSTGTDPRRLSRRFRLEHFCRWHDQSCQPARRNTRRPEQDAGGYIELQNSRR